jgi:glycosyltransferase involved in cell wall biosynthesis
VSNRNGSRGRVLHCLYEFPQLSQTYIQTELDALAKHYDVRVICAHRADTPTETTTRWALRKRPWTARLAVRLFRPDVLHTHWLTQVPRVSALARATGVPFTVRAHSFDLFTAKLPEVAPLLNDGLCLGVLTFPFGRPLLEQAGVAPEKLHDCFPVVDYERFLDRSPNGDAVMNVGACLPKKRVEDFLELAGKVKELRFHHYPIGYHTEEMRAKNRALGDPVEFLPTLPHRDMPREFKRHRWLVYTACPKLRTVGWPLSIAEAQASGVVVCLANVRPDVRQYIGDAGFVFDTVDEAAAILRRPFPDEMREKGFEQARRSDIRSHLHVLTDLWPVRPAGPSPARPIAEPSRRPVAG